MRESKRELKVKVRLNADEKEKTRGRACERWQRRGTGGRGQTGIDSNCAEVFTFKKDLINTILVKQFEEEYLCEKNCQYNESEIDEKNADKGIASVFDSCLSHRVDICRDRRRNCFLATL